MNAGYNLFWHRRLRQEVRLLRNESSAYTGDWPVTVGIDNLHANGNAPVSVPTPEPSSAFTWLLCVGAFGGAAFWLNRRRTAAAAV